MPYKLFDAFYDVVNDGDIFRLKGKFITSHTIP